MVRNDMFYTQYPYMPEAEQETNLLVSIPEFGMGDYAPCCKIHFLFDSFFLRNVFYSVGVTWYSVCMS